MSNPKVLFVPHGNLQYSQLPPEKRGWVVEQSYEKLFDLVAEKGYKIAFEASGYTVDKIAELCPRVMDKMKGLVKDGQLEPIGSPYVHIMISNIDPAIGLQTLKEGRDAWEKHTGFRPSVGWNPECSWADYVPEIYKEAGFDSLVMDGDSFFLSFKEIRDATGLSFDVKGHSNKNKLFQIEEYIKDKPDFLKYLTNPSVAPNGLKMLFRSDMMANIMLWYLMGATEGVRENPVSSDEIRTVFENWKSRIDQSGSFIMPFAEDAEYIGTTAYFYVKQFGQARFFEPEPDSVTRFNEIISISKELGYETATPSEIFASAKETIDNEFIEKVENGIAWHGGTAKAWANTKYARILDPVCKMVFEGLKSVAKKTGKTLENMDGDLRIAMQKLTMAYVSDSRWPPDPTSPGRFNVEESIQDLFDANDAMADAMKAAGISELKSLYSPDLMKTQIKGIQDELNEMEYFGEK